MRQPEVCGVAADTGALPAGVITRLREHYGPPVHEWLHDAPTLVAEIAAEWDLAVLRFHDAGWTSVLAVCERAGVTYVLKVTPDRERFVREQAALSHWRGAPVSALVRACTARRALLLRAVGGRPGGTGHHPDGLRRVAERLPDLHTDPVQAADSSVPLLFDYHLAEVVPRINDRLMRLPHHLDSATVRTVLDLDSEQLTAAAEPVMLHADLYAENIPFDELGQPVFIDPHPMIGPAAYDWAFWCVYYTSERFDQRLSLCRQVAAVPLEEVVRHVAVLALDGYLYYLDVDDPRVASINAVLRMAAALLSRGAQV